MTATSNIHPTSQWDAVVIYGPAASGKTVHSKALARFFMLSVIVDGAHPLPDTLCTGYLYLVQKMPDLKDIRDGVLVLGISRALRAAGIVDKRGVVPEDEREPPLETTYPVGDDPTRDPVTGMTPEEIARSLSSKDTNPKDAVGIAKVPQSVVSRAVLGELGLAMFEGARKYGRHNYRVAGVRASVYFDAVNRHMDAWWEGEDLDPDSELSHVTKAIATLVVLRDAMMNDKFTDDRPPPMKDRGWMSNLNKLAKKLIEKYPDAKPAVTRDTPK